MNSNTRKDGDTDLLSSTGKWMSVRDIARRWGISISAVYGLRAGTNLLKRYRFGSSIRFDVENVTAVEQQILNQHNGKKTRKIKGQYDR